MLTRYLHCWVTFPSITLQENRACATDAVQWKWHVIEATPVSRSYEAVSRFLAKRFHVLIQPEDSCE